MQLTYKATHEDVFLMMSVDDQNDSWNSCHCIFYHHHSQNHLHHYHNIGTSLPLFNKFLLS